MNAAGLSVESAAVLLVALHMHAGVALALLAGVAAAAVLTQHSVAHAAALVWALLGVFSAQAERPCVRRAALALLALCSVLGSVAAQALAPALRVLSIARLSSLAAASAAKRRGIGGRRCRARAVEGGPWRALYPTTCQSRFPAAASATAPTSCRHLLRVPHAPSLHEPPLRALPARPASGCRAPRALERCGMVLQDAIACSLRCRAALEHRWALH
jgi:hypothetical protein